MPSNYSNAKNKFRKVLAYGARAEKNLTTYQVDEITTSSYDANTTIRVRDYYYIPESTTIVPVTMQYFEQIFVVSSYSDEFTFSFSGIVWDDTDTIRNSFIGTPIIVAEIYPSGSETENINLYIKDFSNSNVTLGSSAPYSGSVLVRAIFSNTYPVTVKRYPLFSASYLTASANTKVLTGESTSILTWSALPGTPNKFMVLPGVSINSDIVPMTGSFTTSNTDIFLSAESSDTLYYIAITGSL